MCGIGLLWSKIAIFIIEITLELLYIQNIDEITLTEAGWAWKIQNFIFAISGSSKFIAYTNIQIYVMGSIFIVIIFFFEMHATMSSITINNCWNI